MGVRPTGSWTRDPCFMDRGHDREAIQNQPPTPTTQIAWTHTARGAGGGGPDTPETVLVRDLAKADPS
ncbi:hypothetical protein NDU88_008649 [Pleurodeles waltl]|uniref:Uncharacterized protein n=1 Tax=Pleurodeles waltl TaxID=8319 RepID=A0AAV7PX86_PLEWA|nr:hypothetical protein NDU88_008649 [Pleurodeles waltl]